MKKYKWNILLSVLFAFCFACSHGDSSAAVLKDKMVVTEIATYDYHPVQMVLDPNDNTLELRIQYNRDDNTIFNDDALDFLKHEVIHLTSGQQFTVGSGYSFRFLGGHPVWAPYDGVYLDHWYRCLHFAVQATITDKAIVARGTKAKEGYNGYAEWKPQYNPYK